MKKLILIQIMVILSMHVFSQSVGVGTTSPNASSVMDIQSTSKGLLIPRLTTAQRDAIVTPASGLMILNLDDQCIDIYDGANWIKNCGMKITGTDTLPGEWTQKANVGGGPRISSVGFSIGSKGYIGTGSNGAMKKDFWEYDPATNIWTQKADFGGTHRVGAVGFALLGYGYIGLGFDTGGNYPTDFWEYNPATNTWTQQNNFPGFGRERAVGFEQGSVAYVGTGYKFQTDTWYRDIWEYSPAGDSWFQMNDFPFKAHSLEAFSIGSFSYVGVGWHEGALPPLAPDYMDVSFYQFNSAGFGTWTQVASFPGASRHSAVSFALNNIGYVGTGGNTTGVLYQDFWGYNPSTNTWEQKPNFGGSGRLYATAFAIGDKAYVGTGWDGSNKQDFYEYDPFPQGPVYDNTQPTEDVYSINDGSWTKSVNNVYNSNSGNVGIGTSTPSSKLEVAGTFKLSGTFVSPLTAQNTIANKKLVLYSSGADNHQFYGLGINPNVLRYQVDATSSRHSFYAATGASASNELMSIQGDGNIAMGVSFAQNKLDIQASATRTGTHATARPLYITGSMLEGSNGIEFRHENGTQGIGFGFNTIYATGSNADQNLGLAARGSAGALLLKTNNIERMRITGAGNVGIGIVSPNAPLQFANTLHNRKLVLWESANNDHEFFGFGINSSTLRYQVSYPGDSHVFFAGTGPGSSSELMRIDGNGNMGIINSNPTERLHIGSFGNSANTYMEISTTGGNQFKAGIKLKHFSEGYGWTIESDETTALFHIRSHVNNPAGSNALTIDYNNNITLSGIIFSEAFIAPTLLNGFVNYGNGHANAAFYMDKTGRVHLRGLVNNAANHAGLNVFTLPAGYRPSTSGRLIFTSLAESGVSRIDIHADGNVQVISGSSGWISLDGISFRAD